MSRPPSLMRRYHARWLLPISRPPIDHGTVAVENGRIAYVGERASAPPGDDEELGDVAVLPGLVNTHTHLELTAFRGFLEDTEFQPWIRRLTAARRAALADSDLLFDCARLGILEGLRSGITTYADTCDSGVALAAMRDMGVRGVMYQEAFGPAPERCAAAMLELREKVQALRALETPLVRAGVSPHAPYSVSDDLFRAVASFARDERLPIAVHIAESEAEDAYVRHGRGPFADALIARRIPVNPRGRSPIAVLETTGVLAARPLLIHCVRVDDGDIAAMAAADCAVAHCPTSNAKLGHGVAPLAELLAAGIAVGLGSDSVASNNRMDLLDEARLASLTARGRCGTADAFGASAVLELATLGGARALGLESEIGSLDVGKAADIAAFALEEPHASPVHDAAAALVFGPQRPASIVLVAGEPRVWQGRRVGPTIVPDLAPTLATRVREAADRLRVWGRANSASSPGR